MATNNSPLFPGRPQPIAAAFANNGAPLSRSQTMPDVNNSQDIIDSRDVIERIEELESERQDLLDAIEAAEEARDEAEEGTATLICATSEAEEAAAQLIDWDTGPEAEELAALKSLASEGADYAADWEHGETLIRDSYFKDYAMELADDIGAVDHSAAWPMTCIDWDQAARELKMDYSSIEFSGVTYWIR
jgi:hypothetical protein